MIEVRHARLSDEEQVVDLFLAMVAELAEHGHDLLPTRQNAAWFWDEIFFEAITRGDPVLLAFAGDQPVGALFWVVNYPPYEVRYRTATGWGTYVIPDLRRHGVATALRVEGTRILRDMGIEKLVGTVLVGNEASVAASRRHGLVDVAIVQSLSIN